MRRLHLLWLSALLINAVFVSSVFARNDGLCNGNDDEVYYYLSLDKLSADPQMYENFLIEYGECQIKLSGFAYIIWTAKNEIVWPKCKKRLDNYWQSWLIKLYRENTDEQKKSSVLLTGRDLAFIRLTLVKERKTQAFLLNRLLKDVSTPWKNIRVFFYRKLATDTAELSYIDNRSEFNPVSPLLESIEAQSLFTEFNKVLVEKREDKLDIKLQGLFQNTSLWEKIMGKPVNTACGKNFTTPLGTPAHAPAQYDYTELPRFDAIKALTLDSDKLCFGSGNGPNNCVQVLFKTNFLDDLLNKSTLEPTTTEEHAFVLTYFKTRDFPPGDKKINANIEKELNFFKQFITDYFVSRFERDNRPQLCMEITGYADRRFDLAKVGQLTESQKKEINREYALSRADAVKFWFEKNLDRAITSNPERIKFLPLRLRCADNHFEGDDRSVEIKVWLRDETENQVFITLFSMDKN